MKTRHLFYSISILFILSTANGKYFQYNLLVCSQNDEMDKLNLERNFEQQLNQNQKSIPGKGARTIKAEQPHKIPHGMDMGQGIPNKRPGVPGNHNMGGIDGPMGGMGGPMGGRGPGQEQQQTQPDNSLSTRFKLPYEVEKILELLSFLLLSAYLANFIYGKLQNMNMIETWNERTRELFESEYSHVGFSNNPLQKTPFM